MAADITQAMTTMPLFGDVALPSAMIQANFVLTATTVDMTSFEGGGGGGPIRPTSGFLYPRREG